MDLTIGDLEEPLDRLVSEGVRKLGLPSGLVVSAKDGRDDKKRGQKGVKKGVSQW